MLLAVIDWHALFFWLFALFTCGFAVAVLFADNIVRMAFYLTLSLGASAGLFFLAVLAARLLVARTPRLELSATEKRITWGALIVLFIANWVYVIVYVG